MLRRGLTSGARRGPYRVRRRRTPLLRGVAPLSSSSPAPCAHTHHTLDGAYEPHKVETTARNHWWSHHVAQRRRASGSLDHDRFSMVLPPPNVTGHLHLGHALTLAIEDVLARWKHQSGHDVVWIPGMDHAGIATQVVVERHLAAQQLPDRHALGREAFVDHIQQWVGAKGNVIGAQMRRCGAMLDWDRQVFTLDDARSRAVCEAFVRLHRRGLVHRAKRVVHWCPALRTVISDIETDWMDVTGPTVVRGAEFGVLHWLRYPLAPNTVHALTGEPVTHVLVATTRPETVFGDTALAVHPEDQRWSWLATQGHTAVNPITGASVRIVADPILVDPEQGSGVVKITPGHDFADHDCGQRHGLPSISIMDDSGALACAGMGPDFVGMDRLAARKSVVKHLKDCGLYECAEKHTTRIPICSRSGDVLEPRALPQWFVKCETMAKRAIDFVESGALTLTPDQPYRKEWFHWMGNTREWCVSRQLWWGHRIPAWRVLRLHNDVGGGARGADGGDAAQGNEEAAQEDWVIAVDYEAAVKQVEAERGLRVGTDVTLQQDEDVLDTWFSSGIFPLSALGWPNEDDASLKRYYPLNVLETGSDILFFWVGRMVMLCSELDEHKRPPFDRVVLHPLVRDAQGRKMSKSLGNVIDPLQVMDGIALDAMVDNVRSVSTLPAKEVQRAVKGLRKQFPEGIPACGSDALRFALLHYMAQREHINLDVNRVVAWRHFCNKVWNAAKFVDTCVPKEGVEGEQHECATDDPPIALTPCDKWILAHLRRVVDRLQSSLQALDVATCAFELHQFIQSQLCDVYLEFSKVALYGKDSSQIALKRWVLAHVMSTTLRLLHPFMPYLSEHLWQCLVVERRIMGHVYAEAHPCLLTTSYPETQAYESFCPSMSNDSIATMDTVLTILKASRSLLHAYGIPSSQRVSRLLVVFHGAAAESQADAFGAEAVAVQSLLRADSLDVIVLPVFKEQEYQDHAAHVVTSSCRVLLPVSAINVDAELTRLQQRLRGAEKVVAKAAATVNRNTANASRVPPHVQEAHQQALRAAEEEVCELQSRLTFLKQQMGRK